MHPITAFGIFAFLLLIYITVAPPNSVSNLQIVLSFLGFIGYAILEHMENS